MAKKLKKAVGSSSGNINPGMSAREKMLARKASLESRGSGGIVYPKAGTTRIRIKSPGENEEIGLELVTFYFGKEMGGINSPATFDNPCPVMEKFKELKSSDDEDDKELAKKLVPKRKYLVVADVYADEKGKKIDKENTLVQLPISVYQDIINLYLDEDEWGDMTDPDTGYDVKIIRTGSGQLDTTYSVVPCPQTRIPSERSQEVDIHKKAKSLILTYDEAAEKLAKFLGTVEDDDDDTDLSKRPSSISPKKKIKKKA